MPDEIPAGAAEVASDHHLEIDPAVVAGWKTGRRRCPPAAADDVGCSQEYLCGDAARRPDGETAAHAPVDKR